MSNINEAITKFLRGELNEAPPKMLSGADRLPGVADALKRGDLSGAESNAKNAGPDGRKLVNDIRALARAIDALETKARIKIKVTTK